MSFQLHKSLVSLRNTIKDILDKNREACYCPIDCQVNSTVEVQKRMKSIAGEVHLPSVVQSEFSETTRVLFVRKEYKNNDFFSTNHLLLSVVPFWILPIKRKQRTLFCIRLNARIYLRIYLNKNSASLHWGGYRRAPIHCRGPIVEQVM